jgi:glycosyltransferase involved in cell wall biosynthesis
MKVAYYTSTFFMDVMLETIQAIKNKVELYVFIEISENSKNATLLNIESIEKFNFIEEPETVIGHEKWRYFKPYFDGVKSVKFIVFKNRKSFSLNTFIKSYFFGNYLKKLKISIFHFDNISQRSLGLYYTLKKIKTCISVHDPKSHTGEENWRDDVVNKVYYKLAKGFVFYSSFSKNEFSRIYPKINSPFHVISLLPYTFIRNFLKKNKEEYILFFGRLSYYKGIDILLDAIPKVLNKFPNQKFLIAGANQYDYIINQSKEIDFGKNVKLVEKYLSIEEIAEYISCSKFVVCPYREATQSGVLMTAFASDKFVITTNVGSFKEYVHNGQNGIVITPDADSLATVIIDALNNSNYKQYNTQYSASKYSSEIDNIGKTLIDLYKRISNK